jgi:peroxiredoxin Q/BCP
MTHLKCGEKAPDFSVLNEKGKRVNLSDFSGSKLILYFYPQNGTPTCTVEACNLRDNFKVLKKKGFKILGVSPDDVKKHRNFIAKQKLPFSLLADTTLDIIKAYGVWGPKQLFGRQYDGVLRTTFIIDENGVIENIITKVESKNHAGQILDLYIDAKPM